MKKSFNLIIILLGLFMTLPAYEALGTSHPAPVTHTNIAKTIKHHNLYPDEETQTVIGIYSGNSTDFWGNPYMILKDSKNDAKAHIYTHRADFTDNIYPVGVPASVTEVQKGDLLKVYFSNDNTDYSDHTMSIDPAGDIVDLTQHERVDTFLNENPYVHGWKEITGQVTSIKQVANGYWVDTIKTEDGWTTTIEPMPADTGQPSNLKVGNHVNVYAYIGDTNPQAKTFSTTWNNGITISE